MRVLYVDDEAGLLEVGKLFLEKEGEFSVDTVLSASAALAMLKKNTFDAIISDYQMPEMDGIALLKEVRSRFDNIPFILFTGRGREEVVIEAINNGADFYLQKGGDPTAQFAELAHKIRQAVQQRRAEISIRDHERREADIINFLPDATFAIDTHGVVIAWNRAMETMTGVSAAAILGKGNYEYAIPFYHERRPILVDLVLKDDPATETRYPYVTRSGDKLFSEITIPFLNKRAGVALWFTASPLYDTGGRVIGSIESIRDVTERKRAEEALRESEDRLISIFGAAQVGIILVDAATHRILQANAKALDMFGAAEQDVVGRICHTFICPAEEGRCPVTDLLEAVDSSERVILARGKKKIPVLKTVVRRRIGGRDVLIESFVDITDRKRMEEALAESERRYRGVVETQKEFVCRFLPDGTHVFVNDAYCRYFGKTRNEIIGHRFRPEIPAEDQDAVRQHFASLTRDHPVAQTEHRIILPDGTVRWQWWSDHAIFDESGRIVEYQTTGKDITTRKQAEEALREREATLASIFRAAPTGIGMVINRVITKVNDRLCGMTGYTSAELLGRSARVLYQSDEDYEYVGREKYGQIRKSGTGTVETRWQRKDGTIRDILLSSTPLDPSDLEKGVTFTALDITESKEAEDALRKSEEKFRYLVENALESVLILDFHGKILFANKAVSKLAEVGDSRELLNRNVMDFIAPESREDVIRDFTRVSQGHGALLAHYQVILANGKKITIECVGQLITYEGRPADLLSIRDITESRQHEEVVRQKNLMLSTLNDLQREFAELPAGMRVEELAVKKLSSLSGAIVTMFSTYDPVDQMLTVSSIEYAPGILDNLPGAIEMLTRWLGKSPEDMQMPLSYETYRDINRSIVGIKKSVAEMSYGSISPFVGAGIQKFSGIDHFIHIAHVIDGELYGISVMGLKPGQTDPSWELLESFAHIVAVSLRRQRAEAGLVESEEKYRALFDSAGDAIFIHDLNGKILASNTRACEMLGYTSRDLLSMTVGEVDSPENALRAPERIARMKEQGHISFETAHRRRDGSLIPVAVSAKLVTWEGQPAAMSICHDISDRKRAEEALLQVNRKLNLLSGITRHDIKNQLLTLNGFLEISKKYAGNAAKMSEFIAKERNVVKTMERQIAFTKDYEAIGVNAPVWQDCRTLVDTAAKQFLLGNTMVKNDLPAGLVIFADPLIVKVCYNLMDNALRHGGKITTLRFFGEERDGDHIIVCEDDGAGIPAEEKEQVFERGFGKNTGMGLFLSAEILSITGITIRETGEPGKGARFEITVPKGAWRNITP